MGDESPNAHNSKSMIGFVPSAQQLTLQSSKVQNRSQLLRGCHSTFLIAVGQISDPALPLKGSRFGYEF